jgi:hypothetical protein
VCVCVSTLMYRKLLLTEEIIVYCVCVCACVCVCTKHGRGGRIVPLLIKDGDHLQFASGNIEAALSKVSIYVFSMYRICSRQHSIYIYTHRDTIHIYICFR